ncbi:MAG: ribosomal-processing cysteine protease Prp [Clostridia bacterium]|nr:ribosomal-processing cysteine protease Prp [Clostridia bacterium]
MTTVTVFRCDNGNLAGLRAEGHSNDIVCSAVSVLTQTAVNALEAVAGVPTDPLVDEDIGLLQVMLPSKLTPQQANDCQIILRTIQQGLTDIGQSYPAHLRVVYKEWRETYA